MPNLFNNANRIGFSFHLVNPSPWPLAASVTLFGLAISLIMVLQSKAIGITIMGPLFILLTIIITFWFRDIIRESTILGFHTKNVTTGLSLGFYLFLVSETMVFFGFFWAWFHTSLAPTLELGSVWPPVGINAFEPTGVPLLNTIILVSSGFTATVSHFGLTAKNKLICISGLGLTIILGLIFSGYQALEYIEAPFTIADSSYGSSFFILTGLHGIHVILGTILLIVAYYRLKSNQFTIGKHWFFELSLIYYHFVDLVWLYLYCFIYCWGA